MWLYAIFMYAYMCTSEYYTNYIHRDEGPEDMYEPPPPDLIPPGPPLPSRDSIPSAPGGGGTPRRISGTSMSPTPRPPISLPPRRLPRPEAKEEAPVVPVSNNDLRAPSGSTKDRSTSPSRPSVPRRNYVDITPQPRPPIPIPPPTTRPPIPPVSQQVMWNSIVCSQYSFFSLLLWTDPMIK